MKQKYKVGDIVMLKDGSPPMTIINDKIGDDPNDGYVFDGTYRCAWFNETNEFREIYPQEVLTLFHERE